MNIGAIKSLGDVAEYKRAHRKVLKGNMTITSGLFIINEKGEVLVGHPTNHDVNFYSIPKGRIEDGESYLEAGIRETYEETNLNLKPIYDSNKLISHKMMIEIYEHKKKALYPYIIYTKNNPHFDFDLVELKCDSMVEVKDGEDFPEMDEVKWMPIEEAIEKLHPTQVNVLKKI